jgi:hypothetical protein
MTTSIVENNYAYLHGPKWSPAEKAIARKAFDRALKQELEEIIQYTKTMVAGIKQPSDLWEMEHYLTQRRKEIDRQYDLPLLSSSHGLREPRPQRPSN